MLALKTEGADTPSSTDKNSITDQINSASNRILEWASLNIKLGNFSLIDLYTKKLNPKTTIKNNPDGSVEVCMWTIDTQGNRNSTILRSVTVYDLDYKGETEEVSVV